jgi:hypothetical protein
MESKTKNKKTWEQITSMARRAFDGLGLAGDEGAVRELKEGWFNAAYNVRLADGREVILKIAPPQAAEVMQYEKNIMATEVASMRLVRQNPAIPVPEIYFFDDARDLCDADYFFMEKVDGDNLEHVKASLPAETQECHRPAHWRDHPRGQQLFPASILATMATRPCAPTPGKRHSQDRGCSAGRRGPQAGGL